MGGELTIIPAAYISRICRRVRGLPPKGYFCAVSHSNCEQLRPVQRKLRLSQLFSGTQFSRINFDTLPTAAQEDGCSCDCGSSGVWSVDSYKCGEAVGLMGVKANNSSTRGEEERMGMKLNGAIAPPNEQNLKERLIPLNLSTQPTK
jgi:hypothetical protein